MVHLLALTTGRRTLAASTEEIGFGLTNLLTLQLTLSAADWQLLGSRGGPRERGMGSGNGGGQGFVSGVVRSFFGGDEPPAPGEGPPGRRRASVGEEGGSRFPWATCTVERAGQVLTNVAVRFKGASSLVRAPNGYKRPFKLDFNRGAKGRRFLGVQELYLNNNVNDATQMREALAYELFRRAGIPAPRTAFARVYLTIPGRFEKRHLGLYTLVEAIEDGFVERHVGTAGGLLLKPEMMQGLPYLGDNWRNYTDRYRPRHDIVRPADAEALIAFTRFIMVADPQTFRAELPKYLDPVGFARFVGLNAILANVDSFIGNGHNYYLHVHPETHRSQFLPWDLNEAFGMHPVSGPSRAQMEFSVTRPNADPNPLVERFVSDPELGRIYRGECAWLLTNVFVSTRLAADIDRISAVTRPVVFEESRRARADFERTVLATRPPDDGDTSQPRFDAEFRDAYRPWPFPDAVEVDNVPLKAWIAGREANVRDQLEGRTRGVRARPRLW